MKYITRLMLMTAIISLTVFTPFKSAEAAPTPLFVFTVLIGGWSAATYEECKTEGIDVKECAKKTWRERKDVPITQELYTEMYND